MSQRRMKKGAKSSEGCWRRVLPDGSERDVRAPPKKNGGGVERTRAGAPLLWKVTGRSSQTKD